MDAQAVAIVFLIAGLALAAAEIVAPGLVLLPFGLGAVLASLTGFVGADPIVQTIVFIVASIGFFAAMRPIARRLNRSDNDEGVGSRRLVGAAGIVLEEIPLNETGLVRIDREHWRAESVDETVLAPGTPITVIEVRGTRVLVAAVSLPPTTPTLGGDPT